MKLARIPSSEAKDTIPELLRMDLVDRHAKISKDGSYRLVPILDSSEDRIREMGYDIVDGEAHSRDRTPPQERILRDLSDLPEEVLAHLPMKWEYVGDIVILKLHPSADPYTSRIGRAYAENLDVATVCVDRKGVSGEFRHPDMEVIFGTDTESVRLENGIRYCFDVTKVMFASGNIDERERMKNLDCTGETVVDMFAGIGYFTLPLAKFSGAKKVIACEKNPESYEFLCRNIELNGVQDIVEPVLGDNRDLPGHAIADRILMGYVQITSEFLPKALDLIKPNGIIHYHDTFYVSEYRQRIEDIFDKACGHDGYEILGIREVKSFAPSVSHYVADVRILS
ncbi:MAG: class I SAM-dependent methyltransferase family protein [Candidatus Methanomethylophilaceae archaeon]|nr:class I SAM-dependent methyltransferase family protein [Candidatus Methanomethylophilaceae archaeon]